MVPGAAEGRALTIGLLGLIFGLAACIETLPELVVTAVPSPLRPGEAGTLRVSIVSTEEIPTAVLSVSSPPGLAVSPDRVVLTRVPAVGGSSPPAGRSPPNPPPLGVVPARNFALMPKQQGEYVVTVTLAYGGRSVEKTTTVLVVKD